MDFIYEGTKRRQISFPLGGIGSGCIGLSGYGQLIDWEIFNHPNKGSVNGFTHFAVKAEKDGKLVDARVLHADMDQELCGSYALNKFGEGASRYSLMGMPHFRDCTFEGKFPFAVVRFFEESFPGEVSLEAFNPLIPTNEDDSSIPAAFFAVTVKNTSQETLTYTMAGSLNNPFKGENRYQQKNGFHVLHMTDPFHSPEEFAYGDMTLAMEGPNAVCQENWFKGAWFDNIGVFWQDFTTPGALKSRHTEADGNTEQVGTLTSSVTLAPGEKATVRFVISWNIPNNHNDWASPEELQGGPENRWKNYYAVLFHDSVDSALYALSNWERLYADSKRYQQALFSSTLPTEVLDAVSATVSVLKSPTVLRLEDGSLYGWEGCWMHEGSCEGSCTHVWAYTYAMCYLFPHLERSMRELEYRYDQKPDGGLGFRLMLPLGREPWAFRPCADGQFATVFKTLREYRICGDKEWLRSLWPQVKKALEYAWSPQNYDRWDPDMSGVLTGRQHHTLDMELFGPNSWLESMYLCALKAGAEMAEVLEDTAFKNTCLDLFEKGKKWSEEHLFNGEYFCQKVKLDEREQLEKYKEGDSLIGGSAAETYWSEELGQLKYQIGEGSSIDQVLGQWHANLIGLGEIFSEEKVRSALSAIYRWNYHPSLRDHVNPCRLYGLNDDSGTLICAYPPDREMPVIPVPYAQETMHGFEYQAAAHMVQEGMIEEAMQLVRAVRQRYDGEFRNPWNELECGSNYARSMASFALLPSFAGMTVDMGKKALSFAPVCGGEFACLWSLESGFGMIRFAGETCQLSVLYGELPLSSLSLQWEGKAPVQAELDGEPVQAEIQNSTLEFSTPICIPVEKTLLVKMQ